MRINFRSIPSTTVSTWPRPKRRARDPEDLWRRPEAASERGDRTQLEIAPAVHTIGHLDGLQLRNNSSSLSGSACVERYCNCSTQPDDTGGTYTGGSGGMATTSHLGDI